MQDQDREHRTLLNATKRLSDVPLDHLERTQDAELQR
jgi:hypothetical protein